MTVEERNQVLQWIIDGKCEFNTGSEWATYPYKGSELSVYLTPSETFDQYRRKPEPDPYQVFRDAQKEGKVVQWESPSGIWITADGSFQYPPYRYRIKPEPKLRAWRPEEVPVGAVFRHKESTIIRYPVWQDAKNGVIALDDAGTWEIDTLFKLAEHSIDHGKTWQPCGIYE